MMPAETPDMQTKREILDGLAHGVKMVQLGGLMDQGSMRGIAEKLQRAAKDSTGRKAKRYEQAAGLVSQMLTDVNGEYSLADLQVVTNLVNRDD